MTRTVRNYEFDLETTWQFDIELLNESGGPLDLTGAAVEWRMGVVGQAALVSAEIGTGLTIVGDETTGQLSALISPDDREGVVPGTYTHCCYVTLSDGVVNKEFKGRFTVTDTVRAAAP